MSKFVTFRLPNGHWAALLFTRMTEEDNWICQMPDETMQDLQKMIGNDLYESL
jgi:hypothetical protein